jgi:hypothetical protein
MFVDPFEYCQPQRLPISKLPKQASTPHLVEELKLFNGTCATRCKELPKAFLEYQTRVPLLLVLTLLIFR